jgi:hypothetical protein
MQGRDSVLCSLINHARPLVSFMSKVFPLRLPVSTRITAHDLAAREGLSLNQFIALAVAEKIVRLEGTHWPDSGNGSESAADSVGT